MNVTHSEVNSSTNINDIILYFSGLIDIRIKFQNHSRRWHGQWNKKKLYNPLSGHKILEDCPGKIP